MFRNRVLTSVVYILLFSVQYLWGENVFVFRKIVARLPTFRVIFEKLLIKGHWCNQIEICIINNISPIKENGD